MSTRALLVVATILTGACEPAALAPVKEPSPCPTAPTAGEGARAPKSAGARDPKAASRPVMAAREQLKRLADAADGARERIVRERKLPEGLAADLRGAKIELDSKTVGAMPLGEIGEAPRASLIELTLAVARIEERRTTLLALLDDRARLDEDLTGRSKITHLVLLSRRDPSGNPFGILAALESPIPVSDAATLKLPDEYVAIDPLTRSRVSVPRYKSGSVDKPAGLYVVPRSVAVACPSAPGPATELALELTRIVGDIRGAGKPGLLDHADAIVAAIDAQKGAVSP